MPRKALPDSPLAALGLKKKAKTRKTAKAKTGKPAKPKGGMVITVGQPKRNRTIYLPPELDRALRLYSAEHDQTASDVVAAALIAYLKP